VKEYALYIAAGVPNSKETTIPRKYQ